ncbi:MAG: HD domain-containing protein [Desulfobulbaceae bacterium]|nr:HD domain-containing protein [Desulfobulbaceae bacterium]
MTGASVLAKDWLRAYPRFLREGLALLGRDFPQMFVTGGAVRDWLRGESPGDLDLTLAGDALAAARGFAATCGGAFVLLDAAEGVARVVARGLSVDFSCFREGTTEITADLVRRDFSINALAVAIDPGSGTLASPYTVIDPLGGVADLARGLVRAPAAAVFDCDPVRLLRAFRFAATLDLTVEAQTSAWLRERSVTISRPAPERLSHELELIMASPRAAAACTAMLEAGLLLGIFPELAPGAGLAQPASHHLDVLGHNLAALARMEELLREPATFFPIGTEEFAEYLALPGRRELLKWAALFHDLGKPETAAHKADGRATFYNHDQAGARIFTGLSRRLRWSRERSAIVARLIELHMYPFHLNNALQKTGITPRACLRLVKAAGAELPGLFLLAMADSLAAEGVLKPAGMEASLAQLRQRVETVCRESVRPVLLGPKLIDGEDLKTLGLQPGAIFREILEGIEQARVEGEVTSREEALAWAQRFAVAGAPDLQG